MDPERLSIPEVAICAVSHEQEWKQAHDIFKEYAHALPIDLAFQGFQEELEWLQEHYAPPAGVILLAFVDHQLAGCGALRPLADVDYPNACEMKRLYVRPAFRRFGIGRQISEALLEHARAVGYSVMLLDTMDEMETARGLYESLGFEEIPPYYYNPLPGAHYLKVDLD